MSRGEIACESSVLSVNLWDALQLTCGNFRIYLHARICWNPGFRQLNTLMNWYSLISVLVAVTAKGEDNAYPWPTIASCFILVIVNKERILKWSITYLLILNILSIFLMPSQWRISGINAWNLMSLTPAIFSVLLKYSEARSSPRFLALYTRYYIASCQQETVVGQ